MAFDISKSTLNSFYYSAPISRSEACEQELAARKELDQAIYQLRRYHAGIVTFADCNRLAKMDPRRFSKELARDVEAFKSARKTYLLRTLELARKTIPGSEAPLPEYKSQIYRSLKSIDPHLVQESRYAASASLIEKIRDTVWYFFHGLYIWWTAGETLCSLLAQREILIWAHEQNLAHLLKPSPFDPHFSLIDAMPPKAVIHVEEPLSHVVVIDEKAGIEDPHLLASVVREEVATKAPLSHYERMAQALFVEQMKFEGEGLEAIQALFRNFFGDSVTHFRIESSGYFEIHFSQERRASFRIPGDAFFRSLPGMKEKVLRLVPLLRNEKFAPVKDIPGAREQVAEKLPGALIGFIEGSAIYPSRASLSLSNRVTGHIVRESEAISLCFDENQMTIEAVCLAPNPVSSWLPDIDFSVFVDLTRITRVGPGQVKLGIIPKSHATGIAMIVDQVVQAVNSKMLGGEGNTIMVPPAQIPTGDEVPECLNLPSASEVSRIFSEVIRWS